MRFVFSLNLPTFTGKLVQEVIGDYKASSVAEIYAHIIQGQTWFLVEQFYTYNDRGKKSWEPAGPVLLNSAWVAKIKPFVESEKSD